MRAAILRKPGPLRDNPLVIEDVPTPFPQKRTENQYHLDLTRISVVPQLCSSAVHCRLELNYSRLCDERSSTKAIYTVNLRVM